MKQSLPHGGLLTDPSCKRYGIQRSMSYENNYLVFNVQFSAIPGCDVAIDQNDDMQMVIMFIDFSASSR
jgi:hypothetical protein